MLDITTYLANNDAFFGFFFVIPNTVYSSTPLSIQHVLDGIVSVSVPECFI
jgi:hypothetical protein